MWIVCFFAALGIALAAVVLMVQLLRRYKRGRVLTPLNVAFAGILLSSVILFIPIYIHTMETEHYGAFEAVLLSVHNMIRLFIVDGEFSVVTQNIAGLQPWLYSAYCVLFSILFVLAPVLTFSFVLSFFKNIAAYGRLLLNCATEGYVFSELNEKSLALASSIAKQPGRKVFVYTDVFEKEEEESYELVERAHELGAICFKKDIVTINFKLHTKKSPLHFFAIGEDQAENISQALKLIELYRVRENTNLYVISEQAESELLLANTDCGKIKVRRINEVQSLIYRNLYENGLRIFEHAEDGVISAVVVGMGSHGTEMTRALSWFCQMDGYRPYIRAYDMDPKAEEKFRALCPELMEKSGNFEDDGEAMYELQIFGGVHAESESFLQTVQKLGRVTYVMVALGNDELNIRIALRLRTLFERLGINPMIQTIVYNSEKCAALQGVKNYSGQEYNIDFVGDLRSTYSYDVVLDSDLEGEALARHMKWGEEDAFWKYEYNYRSSVASALHRHMKHACKMPGIELPPAERSERDLWALRRMEHRRWNAYMRAEGYVYAPVRNNLAKTHHCLVTFDLLSEKDKMKDDD